MSQHDATAGAPVAAADSIDDDQLVDELIAGRQGDFVAPRDMPAWMATTIRRIDSLSRAIGHAVCWLVVPVFVAMVYEIIARKFFVAPTIWAYDVSRILYGALFMLGSAFGLLRGVHIRADFLYRSLSSRAQGAIDATLFIIFFFPSMLVFLYVSGEWTIEAFERMERIDDTPWKPYAWVVRAIMCVSVFFLIVQGVSETLKAIYAAWRGRWHNE